MAGSEQNNRDSIDTGRKHSNDKSGGEPRDVEESRASAGASDSHAEELRDSERNHNEDYGEVY